MKKTKKVRRGSETGHIAKKRGIKRVEQRRLRKEQKKVELLENIMDRRKKAFQMVGVHQGGKRRRSIF